MNTLFSGYSLPSPPPLPLLYTNTYKHCSSHIKTLIVFWLCHTKTGETPIPLMCSVRHKRDTGIYGRPPNNIIITVFAPLGLVCIATDKPISACFLATAQTKLVKRRTVLPERLKDTFGEANMALARCQYDEVITKCMAIIKQGKMFVHVACYINYIEGATQRDYSKFHLPQPYMYTIL